MTATLVVSLEYTHSRWPMAVYGAIHRRCHELDISLDIYCKKTVGDKAMLVVDMRHISGLARNYSKMIYDYNHNVAKPEVVDQIVCEVIREAEVTAALAVLRGSG